MMIPMKETMPNKGTIAHDKNASFDNPISDINGWSLTDDDCFQYTKALNDIEYMLIQMQSYRPDTDVFCVVSDALRIDEYLADKHSELLSILSSYGYTVEGLIEEYNEKRNQIIAECIFETKCLTISPQFIGSEKECYLAILEYCKTH